jgi:hypothetical protein
LQRFDGNDHAPRQHQASQTGKPECYRKQRAGT